MDALMLLQERASLPVCTTLCYMAVKDVVSWHEKLLSVPIPPSGILLQVEVSLYL